MKPNLFQMCKHSPLYILPALLFCIFASCRQDTVYYMYLPIQTQAGWNKQDTLVYQLPDKLTPGSYKLEIGLRNTHRYPFRDIWLSVSQNMKDSLLYETDTLHFYLADEQGEWENGGNTGNLFQHTYLCDRPLTVNPSDSTFLRLTHLMKKNPLPGINDAGIRLIKDKDTKP